MEPYLVSIGDRLGINLSSIVSSDPQRIEGRFCFDDVFALVRAFPHVQDVVFLDLSACVLSDRDIPRIIGLLSLLPNCEVLSLAACALRFITVEDLRSLWTHLVKRKWVDISFTRAAAHYNDALYDCLEREDFCHVLFASEEAVAEGLLPNDFARFDDPSVVEGVLSLHRDFFDFLQQCAPYSPLSQLITESPTHMPQSLLVTP
eukprot:m.48402 g.48402  ORF g.48402 m.48402 type:complete len:204 (-) comp6031_c0_seq1:1989-2600(-)